MEIFVIYRLANSKGHQMSRLPKDLLLQLKVDITKEIVLRISLDKEKYIITTVYPYTSINNAVYELHLSTAVLGGVKEISEIYTPTNNRITMNHIQVAKVYEAKEIEINIITKSSKGVINLKSQDLPYLILKVIHKYRIQKDVVIKCEKNFGTDLSEINYILVKNVVFIDSKASLDTCAVAEVNKQTSIKILKIESKMKQEYMLRKQVPLGGLGEISEQLSSLISNSKSDGYCFNSVLLVGPPGCGKTSLAKEVSYKSQCFFLTTHEVDQVEDKSIASSFIKVLKKAEDLSKEGPCVIFIDEIDGLAPNIQSKSGISNKIRALLKRSLKNPKIFVIVATNRPYALHPKVKDIFNKYSLHLGVPTKEQRKEILSIHCRNLSSADRTALTTIAECTPGFVGADLALLAEQILQLSKITNSEGEHFLQHVFKLIDNTCPSIHKKLAFGPKKPRNIKVGGLNEVKNIIEESFFHPHEFSEMYNKFKVPKSKGVLMYGPPGCGKTKIASYMASKRGSNFIPVNAADLLSQYVGDSEKNIAALFHSARIAQPCIIFLDEIDGIFRSRLNEHGAGVYTTILGEILQEMDGIGIKNESRQGISSLAKCEDVMLQQTIQQNWTMLYFELDDWTL